MLHKLLIFCLVYTTVALQAASIVVIQGDHTEFGRKYFAGFSSLVKHSVSAYKYSPQTEASLIGKIAQIRPDLIMSIGAVPLEKFMNRFPSTPIIVADYRNPKLSNKANILMLDTTQPIEQAFKLSEKILDKTTTWGFVYDQKYSQHAYERIQELSKKMGIKVLAIKVSKESDVNIATLSAFKGKIGAFLFLRDITLNQTQAKRSIQEFCKNNQIPIISLNPVDADNESLLNVSIDPIALGQQAHQLAETIINTHKIPQLPTNTLQNQIISTVSLGKLSQTGVSDAHTLTFFNQVVVQGIRIQLKQ